MNTQPRRAYGPLAKGLHWLIFLLLAGQFLLGWMMSPGGHGPVDPHLFAWRVYLGIVLILAALAAVGGRLLRPVAPVPRVRPAERYFSRALHLLLYGLVVALPALGVAAIWYPDLYGPHRMVAYALLGVAILHVADVLYHYFVRGDETLQRILPAAHWQQHINLEEK
ncbi:MAG TPA: cytochrome b/b6 domain-containing protein [Rhizomicrobium sp.]